MEINFYRSNDIFLSILTLDIYCVSFCRKQVNSIPLKLFPTMTYPTDWLNYGSVAFNHSHGHEHNL